MDEMMQKRLIIIQWIVIFIFITLISRVGYLQVS